MIGAAGIISPYASAHAGVGMPPTSGGPIRTNFSECHDRTAPARTAPRRLHLRLHHRAARHAGARRRHSGVAEARGRFPCGRHGAGRRNLRNFRHRLGADAVRVLADPRCAVRPLRATAGDPDLQFRPRPRLHPDGAGAEPVVAVRRARDLRHLRGEHRHRVRLYRRCLASPSSAPPVSACSVSPSARVSCSARRSAGLPAASIRICRSGSQPDSASATRSMVSWSCRNRCRPSGAPPFAWRRANPLGAFRLLRSHSRLMGLASVNFLGNLAHASLPRDRRALHDVPLRLGRAHRRLHHGGRGFVRDGGAGRADPPGDCAHWRARRAHGRAGVRCRGLRGVRPCDAPSCNIGPASRCWRCGDLPVPPRWG